MLGPGGPKVEILPGLDPKREKTLTQCRSQDGLEGSATLSEHHPAALQLPGSPLEAFQVFC